MSELEAVVSAYWRVVWASDEASTRAYHNYCLAVDRARKAGLLE
jgi:hypothetical protein